MLIMHLMLIRPLYLPYASASVMAMRIREYAIHADYAQIREYADADADENLIVLI